jgi:hypothetical protein
MLSGAMAPKFHDLRAASTTAAADPATPPRKWSAAARLRLIILPSLAIWCALIWIAVSLI